MVLAELELQMMHWSLIIISNEGAPSRPIIILFHSFLEKERVLASARAKAREGGGIQWDGSRLSLFPDMTRDVAERRRPSTDVRQKLHDLVVRFTFRG